MGHETIRGKRVLIVEDRYLLADDLRRLLEDAGVTVLGPVSTVDAAIPVIEAKAIDCALLDIDLKGELGFSVADALASKGVPYIFVTGFEPSSLPARYASAPFLSKPVGASRLNQLLGQTLRATEESS